VQTQTQTYTLVLGGPQRTRLVARLVTYVAGRGLAIDRLDVTDTHEAGFVLLRVTGPQARLDVLPRQLDRIPGVVAVGAPTDLRRVDLGQNLSRTVRLAMQGASP